MDSSGTYRTQALRLPKEDMDFIYNQLTVRKMVVEEEMIEWAEKKDISEIRRCVRLIEKIESIQKVMLS
jgi:hypothetical protein